MAMTEKDKIIQTQQMKIETLTAVVGNIVRNLKLCRYCKYLDADCSPTGSECKPEWRGY